MSQRQRRFKHGPIRTFVALQPSVAIPVGREQRWQLSLQSCGSNSDLKQLTLAPPIRVGSGFGTIEHGHGRQDAASISLAMTGGSRRPVAGGASNAYFRIRVRVRASVDAGVQEPGPPILQGSLRRQPGLLRRRDPANAAPGPAHPTPIAVGRTAPNPAAAPAFRRR